MANNSKIQEREVINRVAEVWFSAYDTKQMIGNIDFCVACGKGLFEQEYFMWAEAKRGKSDIHKSLVQLILTIGKARTFDKHNPPPFLGAFDSEQIAFLPYNKVMDVFEQNDFNWNVTPSDHTSKEFIQLHHIVWECLKEETLRYNFDTDAKELREFIRRNFVLGKGSLSKLRINKNNFTHIYRKWLSEVKPSICINWEEEDKLLDADFFLADIISKDNKSIMKNLSVLLESDMYRINISSKGTGRHIFEEVQFNDGQKAHKQFWKKYERPPKEEYWDYIVNRRDLLVPQDIRERKGSFFTPVRWVELSQEYIARELGEEWQDEYYVWDCCAGTGNLLAGLTNKYNIYASTLDMADVNVMKELIESNSINLLDEHVFQFDFLNDDFSKLPPSLLDIVNDPDKRKKLVIYINPPYAEASTATNVTGTGKNKKGVAKNNYVSRKYGHEIQGARNELFALFFIRIYRELGSCILAEFSKLKILQGQNFERFHNIFQAKLCNLFVVPANTFDNVIGRFPVGFLIWDTNRKEHFKSAVADVYDKDAELIGVKGFYSYDKKKFIIEWANRESENNTDDKKITIGFLSSFGNDFAHQKYVCFINDCTQMAIPRGWWITDKNFIPLCIFLSVRHCIETTWLNDRDQFLYPDDSWKDDLEFQSDCLAYTLFHGQNRISSKEGTNHWIPFTEGEVGAKERFKSHFMSDYINGKRKVAKASEQGNLFSATKHEVSDNEKPKAIHFSSEAQAVMDAGKKLWRYYHSQPQANPNASFYDIRLHFQKINEKGKMNSDSKDEKYNLLIKDLRTRLKKLAKKIEPKVYKYGFLLK